MEYMSDHNEAYASLFSQHVPESGKANSVAGEMLRAINEMEYRLNDGDGRASDWDTTEFYDDFYDQYPESEPFEEDYDDPAEYEEELQEYEMNADSYAREMTDDEIERLGVKEEACPTHYLMTHGNEQVRALAQEIYSNGFMWNTETYRAKMLALGDAVVADIKNNPGLAELPTEDMFTHSGTDPYRGTEYSRKEMGESIPTGFAPSSVSHAEPEQRPEPGTWQYERMIAKQGLPSPEARVDDLSAWREAMGIAGEPEAPIRGDATRQPGETDAGYHDRMMETYAPILEQMRGSLEPFADALAFTDTAVGTVKVVGDLDNDMQLGLDIRSRDMPNGKNSLGGNIFAEQSYYIPLGQIGNDVMSYEDMIEKFQDGLATRARPRVQASYNSEQDLAWRRGPNDAKDSPTLEDYQGMLDAIDRAAEASNRFGTPQSEIEPDVDDRGDRPRKRGLLDRLRGLGDEIAEERKRAEVGKNPFGGDPTVSRGGKEHEGKPMVEGYDYVNKNGTHVHVDSYKNPRYKGPRR